MHHCGRFIRPFSRREMLSSCASGFGAVALAALMHDSTGAATGPAKSHLPLAHFRPKAKNVIFLYMDGGPSQVDTFDYKPMLEKFNGQDPAKAMGKLEPTQFANIG